MISDAELASAQGAMQAPQAVPGTGLNAAYQEAFQALLAAETPQAKNAALSRMELAAFAGPERTAPAAAAPLNNSQAYRDALARAMAAPTASARSAVLAEMEGLAQMATDVAAASAQNPAGPPEGLEPARSAGELPLPPQLLPHIADMAAFEATREAAVAVGLPKALWSEGLAQAVKHSHLQGASEDVWNQHMDGVLATLEKIHGAEGKPGIVRDGAAYINALGAADPRLAEAADLMRASPWAITQAAQLWRAGVRPAQSRR